MNRLLKLALTTAVVGATNPKDSTTFGPTFGTGLAGISICEAPSVVLNYTLSATATHGVLHHFWATGAQIQIDTAYFDYYIDGEMSPSISMQPAMMCGLAFPKEYIAANPTKLYTAGSACGKNAPVGGWFNTYPIPFSKSVLVLVRSSTKGCSNGYINIRGTENLPVVLPGGYPLPNNARLQLQQNTWAVRQPLEYINITSMPSGTKGMVFQSTLAVETQPIGGSGAGGGYIEGCWHFYRQHTEMFPGMVVGTGVEDYFDSGYYFGADSGYKSGDPWNAGLSGVPLFQRTPDGTERISAYRFHNHDPLVFTDGGALVWRVGAKGLPGTSKCGNPFPKATGPLPPTPAPVPSPPEPPSDVDSPPADVDSPQSDVEDVDNLGRTLSPINMTSYGWVYTWD